MRAKRIEEVGKEVRKKRRRCSVGCREGKEKKEAINERRRWAIGGGRKRKRRRKY